MNKPTIYRTPWKDQQGTKSWCCCTLSDQVFGEGWTPFDAYEDWGSKNSNERVYEPQES